jgi:hypothetical protein
MCFLETSLLMENMIGKKHKGTNNNETKEKKCYEVYKSYKS